MDSSFFSCTMLPTSVPSSSSDLLLSGPREIQRAHSLQTAEEATTRNAAIQYELCVRGHLVYIDYNRGVFVRNIRNNDGDDGEGNDLDNDEDLRVLHELPYLSQPRSLRNNYASTINSALATSQLMHIAPRGTDDNYTAVAFQQSRGLRQEVRSDAERRRQQAVNQSAIETGHENGLLFMEQRRALVEVEARLWARADASAHRTVRAPLRYVAEGPRAATQADLT